MKKTISIILTTFLCLSLSFFVIGCSDNKNNSQSENQTTIAETTAKETTISPTEFDTNIKIEKTVLRDEDGIKITATRIGKADWNAMNIYLTCTNNTNQPITFSAGSVSDYDGRVALTVNGQEFNEFHAAEGANCEVEPGKSSEMVIALDINEAEEKGIYLVDTIDLGMSIISNNNESGDYLYPLTLQVKKK